MGGRHRAHSMPLGRLGKPAIRCLPLSEKFECTEASMYVIREHTPFRATVTEAFRPQHSYSTPTPRLREHYRRTYRMTPHVRYHRIAPRFMLLATSRRSRQHSMRMRIAHHAHSASALTRRCRYLRRSCSSAKVGVVKRLPPGPGNFLSSFMVASMKEGTCPLPNLGAPLERMVV